MNALHSLYDALMCAGIANDKARAVVDAFEHEMTQVLATKADIEHRFALERAYLDGRFVEFQAQIDLRFGEFQAQMDRRFGEAQAQMDRRFGEAQAQMDRRFGEFQAQIDLRFAAVEMQIALLRKDMEIGFDRLRTWVLFRVGAMQVATSAILFAALKLT